MAVVLVQNGVHSWPKSHFMHDEVGNDVSSGLHFGLNSTITKVALLVLMFFISVRRYVEALETKKLLLEYGGNP